MVSTKVSNKFIPRFIRSGNFPTIPFIKFCSIVGPFSIAILAKCCICSPKFCSSNPSPVRANPTIATGPTILSAICAICCSLPNDLFATPPSFPNAVCTCGASPCTLVTILSINGIFICLSGICIFAILENASLKLPPNVTALFLNPFSILLTLLSLARKVLIPVPAFDNPSVMLVPNFLPSSIPFVPNPSTFWIASPSLLDIGANIVIDLPSPATAGPIVTSPAIALTSNSTCSGFNALIFSASPLIKSIPFDKYGTSFSPITIPASETTFFIICNFEASVSYLLFASFVRALFSVHAVLPSSSALFNKSPDPASLNIVSLNRTSLMPISSNTAIVVFPFFSDSPSPFINAEIAELASSLKAFENSLLLIPATSANCFRSFPPFSVANCMFIINFEKALPPASASMPTDDSVVANANISASVNPICDPAPASLVDMFTMSFSVVAKLFPRATTVLPSLSKFS